MAKSSGEVAFLRGLVSSEETCRLVAGSHGRGFPQEIKETFEKALREESRNAQEKTHEVVRKDSFIKTSRNEKSNKPLSATDRAIRNAGSVRGARQASLASIEKKREIKPLKRGVVKRAK